MTLYNKILEIIMVAVPTLALEKAQEIANRLLVQFENGTMDEFDMETEVRTVLIQLNLQEEKENKELNSKFEELDLDDALANLKAKVNMSTTNPENLTNIQDLETLKDLRNRGIITEEEFERLKSRVS